MESSLCLTLVFVCLFIVGFRGSLCSDLQQQCPCIFQNATRGTVKCIINKQGIEKANCSARAAVTFDFKAPGASSGTFPCISSYPPLSCSPVTGDDQCGCTADNTATTGTYLYEWNFLAVENIHTGGELRCALCISPRNTFIADIGQSCTAIHFDVCASGPCKNGGTCKANTEATCDRPYHCLCTPFYSGLYCEDHAPKFYVAIIIPVVIACCIFLVISLLSYFNTPAHNCIFGKDPVNPKDRKICRSSYKFCFQFWNSKNCCKRPYYQCCQKKRSGGDLTLPMTGEAPNRSAAVNPNHDATTKTSHKLNK